jgi:hypothetical protein
VTRVGQARRAAPVAAGAALLCALAAGCFTDGGTEVSSGGPTTQVAYQVDDGCGAAGLIGFLGYANGTVEVTGAEWCGLPTEAEALVAGSAKAPSSGGWRLHGNAYLCAAGAGAADGGDCDSWTEQWRLCTATAANGLITLPCVDYQDNVVCTATLTPQP